MAYIGTSPSNGVRRRFVYVATANQTSFSGNDENGISLVYVDVAYLDVYQNGVKLKSVDDYASTTGTSVVLVQGASADDVVEIIAFDVFSIGDTVSAADGGNFGGNVGMGGTLAVTGVPTFTGRSVHSGGITVANAGQIGSVGDADSMAIASNGVVTFSQIPVFSAGGGGLDPDGAVTLNESGADVDFRVESDIKTHAFFMEGSNGRIVINAADATGQASHVTILFESAAYSAFAGRMTDNGSGAGFLICRKSDGATIGQVKRNGTSDAVQYVTTSDYRLKENVNYSWDGTTELKKLKPCRYNWINDESNDLYEGFLAHEVQSVVPCAASGDKDAVDTDGNIEPQGIDQSLLVPLLTKTILELEARITALENA